jgi:hypothetical protein
MGKVGRLSGSGGWRPDLSNHVWSVMVDWHGGSKYRIFLLNRRKSPVEMDDTRQIAIRQYLYIPC